MNIGLSCSYFFHHIIQATCRILGKSSEGFYSLFLTEIQGEIMEHGKGVGVDNLKICTMLK